MKYKQPNKNLRKINNKSRVLYEYNLIDKKTKTLCASNLLGTSEKELKKEINFDGRIYKLVKTGKYNVRKDIYFGATSTSNSALGGIVTQAGSVVVNV